LLESRSLAAPTPLKVSGTLVLLAEE
jgi:hypothetical protein